MKIVTPEAAAIVTTATTEEAAIIVTPTIVPAANSATAIVTTAANLNLKRVLLFRKRINVVHKLIRSSVT